jgi:hypothetical protein
MAHKTTGRLSRLNHRMSKVGMTPAYPRVWQQGLGSSSNPPSTRFSGKAQTVGLFDTGCLQGELEEGGHAE